MALNRVNDAGLRRELAVGPGHLTILLDSKLHIPLGGREFDTIEVSDIVGDAAKATIQLHTRHFLERVDSHKSRYDCHDRELKVGGAFSMGQHAFTVVKIVPPDDDRKIVGWVELAHQETGGARSEER